MDDAADTPLAPAVSRPRRLWLLLVLCLALAVRLPGYTESVWLDELLTSNLFCGDAIVLLKTLVTDIHPPAYFVFMHFWNALVGDGEVWLRMPALLCGLGSVVLIWRLGVMFVGPSTGLMAAFLLAVSPVGIWYSQEARPYSTNIFMLLACVVSFSHLLIGPRRWGWTLLYLFTLGCVVFTHYYLVVFPLVFLLFAVLHKSENRGRLSACSVIVLALFALYVGAKTYFFEVPTTMPYLRPFDGYELWHLGFGWFLTGNSLNPIGQASATGEWLLVILQIGAVAAVLRGVWRLTTCKPTPTSPAGLHLVVYLMVLPACLLGLTLIGLDQTYIERSALPALPFFLVLLAAGLTGWRNAIVARTVAGVAAVAAIVVLAAYFKHSDDWTVYKPNPDWRGAAAMLGEELDGTDRTVLLYSDYVSPTALTYYDERMQEVKQFEQNTYKIEKLESRAKQVFGTDGLFGEQIQAAIATSLTNYAARLEAAEEGMRLSIRELSKHDPLQRSPIPTEFWLLVHRHASPRAVRLLDDSRVVVIEEKAFRELRLYQLRCEQ